MATEKSPDRDTVLKVFLFTDLVGSTALKRKLGDAASAEVIAKLSSAKWARGSTTPMWSIGFRTRWTSRAIRARDGVSVHRWFHKCNPWDSFPEFCPLLKLTSDPFAVYL